MKFFNPKRVYNILTKKGYFLLIFRNYIEKNR